jgi:hypothetical protein
MNYQSHKFVPKRDVEFQSLLTRAVKIYIYFADGCVGRCFRQIEAQDIGGSILAQEFPV